MSLPLSHAVHAPIPLPRRRLLAWLAAGAALPLASACQGKSPPAHAYPLSHSDDEWRHLLTPQQFWILRQAGTERPFTSPLLNEHRAGRFVCAADNNPLFDSHTKFDSGTGWPSFWQALPRAVELQPDTSFGELRTEVRCSKCGGHLGHVFDDGPAPTGKRYCMNGLALKFVAA